MVVLRKILIALAVIAVLMIAVVAVLRLCSVPYRAWDSQAFAAQQGFTRVTPDAQIQRMIQRDRLDFIISPTGSSRDVIEFMFAKQDSTTLYLFFRPHWSHTAIVYAYDRSTRKSQWKTEIDTDPDR
ncbi:MAG: hypothetical protein DMF06_11080 [Verrucomicrobia bacterium]|nr:MAG: hypothetical protein DMF06_11080 [Verrucomicrobiota bacterium]